MFLRLSLLVKLVCENLKQGGLAQMVERPLSMREVPGSIPGSSTPFLHPPHTPPSLHAFKGLIDGIKAMSRGFLGQTTNKKLLRNRDRDCLFIEPK